MDSINLQVIRESFGRVVYSHKTHEKAAEISENSATYSRWANVVLTALTSSSFLGAIITNSVALTYIGSGLALVGLGLVLFQLSFNPDEQAAKHRHVAKELWKIREDYINLMADIVSEHVDTAEIVRRRDKLTERLGIIYKFAPQTDSKAYKAAQKALKVSEDLTFSDAELNAFLPDVLHIGEFE